MECESQSEVMCKVSERNSFRCKKLRGQGHKVCEGELKPVIAKCSFSLSGTGWYRDGYR